MSQQQIPTLIIEPVSGFRSIKVREIWEFRDLLLELGMRDVKLVYKQTLLGVLWVLLQPLIGAVIFAFVFGIVAKLPTGSTPYFVFSLTGMLGWTLFSATLNASSAVMLTNSHLVSKIYFPRLILPLSSAFQPIVNFAVGAGALLIVMLIWGMIPRVQILLLPVAACLLLCFALGLGFLCSSIIIRYRDMRYVIPVIIQFLLYASPVGYSLEAIQLKVPSHLQSLYMLNPLASLCEFFRWAVLGEGVISPLWLAYSSCVSIFSIVLGAYAFRRSEKNFADLI